MEALLGQEGALFCCLWHHHRHIQLLWLWEELEVGGELRAGLWAVGMGLPHAPLRNSKIL